MPTLAYKLRTRYRRGSDVKALVFEIDPLARIESFLYLRYLRIVFSDGSKIIFAGGKLALNREDEP